MVVIKNTIPLIFSPGNLIQITSFSLIKLNRKLKAMATKYNANVKIRVNLNRFESFSKSLKYFNLDRSEYIVY